MVCLKGNFEIQCIDKYVVARGEFYETDPSPLTCLSVWGPGSSSYLAGLALNSFPLSKNFI